MRTLGFWLKALGVSIGAFALAGFGFDLENGGLEDTTVYVVGMLLAIGGGLAWAGSQWHASLVPDDGDYQRGFRRLRPGKNTRWLPHKDWRDFPDPVPEVRDLLGDPVVDIPSGDVPPDENLRRLWLVRANLAIYLDDKTAKARRRFAGVGTVAVASLGLACGVLLMIDPVGPALGERTTLAGMFSTAFLLWPFARSLLGYTKGSHLVSRRREALQEEETRLMALDAMRPGGPIGGSAVTGTTPYVPPSLAQYRQEPATEEPLEPPPVVPAAEPPAIAVRAGPSTLSRLGYTLKVLAVVVACGAFFVVGHGAQNGHDPRETWTWFAILGAAAVGLAAPGQHWHVTRTSLSLNFAQRPGTRPFEPDQDREWLPNEAWPEFPDPLPDVPDVIGDPSSDIPAGQVPPDDTLRRLWLVRAQLVVHLSEDTVRNRTKSFPQTASSTAAVLSCVTIIMVGLSGRSYDEPWFLGALFAGLFMLVPSVWTMLAFREGFELVTLRREALQAEERRLIECDQRRRTGPLGGPPLRDSAVAPYVPPKIRLRRLSRG
ncbi:MAG: hypothetical protein ABW224_19395 [Kibdelosporangium sp.]